MVCFDFELEKTVSQHEVIKMINRNDVHTLSLILMSNIELDSIFHWRFDEEEKVRFTLIFSGEWMKWKRAHFELVDIVGEKKT